MRTPLTATGFASAGRRKRRDRLYNFRLSQIRVVSENDLLVLRGGEQFFEVSLLDLRLPHLLFTHAAGFIFSWKSEESLFIVMVTTTDNCRY